MESRPGLGKAIYLIGTGIIAAAALYLGITHEPEEEEQACYYLDFSEDNEGEWKEAECDTLGELLWGESGYAVIDEYGQHFYPDLSFTPTPEPTATPEGCLNPYEEGIGVNKKINRIACWYGFRPEFLQGLWQVESKRKHTGPGGQVKVSYAGAIGIGQVMPGHTGLSVVDGHNLDIWEEVDNMELGAQVLENKCDAAVYIANVNGFETRPASEDEPCGAIHYMCAGGWGSAYSIQDEKQISWGTLLHDEWYSTPEDVMARAYNGVSCGGNLIPGYGWQRGREISYWTIHYVESVQDKGGVKNHSFNDAP